MKQIRVPILSVVAVAVASLAGCVSTCELAGKVGEWEIHEWPEGAMQGVKRSTESRMMPAKGGSDREWKTVIYRPAPAERNGKVLWYFHGACDGPDITRAHSARATHRAWEDMSRKPVVVGISLGDFWSVDKDLSREVQALMNEIRKDYGLEAYGNWALGVSMGGHNALQVHGDLDGRPGSFERVVLVAPRPVRFRTFKPKATFERPRDVLIIQGEKDEFGFFWRNRKVAKENGFCLVTHGDGHRLPREEGKNISRFFESGQPCPACP